VHLSQGDVETAKVWAAELFPLSTPDYNEKTSLMFFIFHAMVFTVFGVVVVVVVVVVVNMLRNGRLCDQT
jgi:heme/copper-type cytochrome/quinol oxidase subunit 2